MTDETPSRLRGLLWLAAVLAAFSSLAFAFASPAHVEDGWEYRGFFLVVAAGEMALAVVLLAWSWRSAPFTERDVRGLHGIVVVGAVVAATGVIAYVFTFVTGIQHVGHSPETIAAGPAPLDLVTRVAEAALVAVLTWLAVLTSAEDQEPAGQAE